MDPEHHQTKRDGDEMDLQKPPSAPRLCANNCGFFGSPATNNLCSKCHRQASPNMDKSSAKKPDTSNSASAKALQQAHHHHQHPVDEKTTNDDLSSFSSSSSPTPPPRPATTADVSGTKPNRCGACRKKVGLMGFWCRCGGVFCPAHRYSDKHACAFDYKAAAQDAIARANPVLKPDKLDKI